MTQISLSCQQFLFDQQELACADLQHHFLPLLHFLLSRSRICLLAQLCCSLHQKWIFFGKPLNFLIDCGKVALFLVVKVDPRGMLQAIPIDWFPKRLEFQYLFDQQKGVHLQIYVWLEGRCLITLFYIFQHNFSFLCHIFEFFVGILISANGVYFLVKGGSD